MVAGGQALGQTLGDAALMTGGGLDVLQQAGHFLGEDALEQLGLVLEVGEDGAGRHSGALGDVADGGGVVSALGEQGARGVQHLLAGADLGGLTAVHPGRGFGFGGLGGGQGGLTHQLNTLAREGLNACRS
ncbi:hypothetical protein D3C80_1356350 [compost metagenome]